MDELKDWGIAMKLGRIVLAAVLIVAAVAAWYGYGRWYGRPPAKTGTPSDQRQLLYYHCPMHPDYHSDKPGNCPICGMKLVPVFAAEKPAGPTGAIEISPEQQRLYGVQTGTATIETAVQTLRAVGKIQMDETRQVRIHSRVDGWIEEVYADYMGQSVRKGQPLLTLYSPELLASQQEYLLALRAKDILNASTVPGVAAGNDSLIQAARRRLELLDLTEEQIEQLTRTGQPLRAVPLYSPSSGYVTARNAFPKQRVTPDTELYTLSDLSRVWVMANVLEFEAPSLRVGQAATVTTASEASGSSPARIDNIQPALDESTRTVKVRLDLDNAGLKWKPDMFVNVEFRLGGAPGLFVPMDAVLDSGLTKTVYLDHGDGHFEPRPVETGREFNGKVEIVKGLLAGERIVISGNFLVDSESRLRAASSGAQQHDQPAH
jgi:RND family efflux transporter MFP subunit